MEKGHWNRKRVYSIRKFAVGACSVMIGTCAVLFGGSVIGESPVFADETQLLTLWNKQRGKSGSGGKRRSNCSRAQGCCKCRSKSSHPIEASKPEKKEEEPVAPKEEKASLKPEETAPKVESQASSQEKPVKEDLKAATNEEVNQMIEDRKVNFNQIGTLNSMRILKKL